MPFTKARDGIFLHVKDASSGTPVVLIRGGRRPATCSNIRLALVHTGYRIITDDRRGPDAASTGRDVASALHGAGFTVGRSVVEGLRLNALRQRHRPATRWRSWQAAASYRCAWRRPRSRRS